MRRLVLIVVALVFGVILTFSVISGMGPSGQARTGGGIDWVMIAFIVVVVLLIVDVTLPIARGDSRGSKSGRNRR
jgi:hypothetical protein